MAVVREHPLLDDHLVAAGADPERVVCVGRRKEVLLGLAKKERVQPGGRAPLSEVIHELVPVAPQRCHAPALEAKCGFDDELAVDRPQQPEPSIFRCDQAAVRRPA